MIGDIVILLLPSHRFDRALRNRSWLDRCADDELRFPTATGSRLVR